ncbi:MAG: MazG nucleotide pyrophosphohydrolase domain-containing protein [Sulfolobales archaeon]
MTIKEVQKMMKSMFYERDRSRGVYATFTWLVEEVGELAEAILGNDIKSIQEEIADVIAWTLSLANLLDIDVEEAIKEKYYRNTVSGI